MYRTDDPVQDAERYYEEQEAKYAVVDNKAICECCHCSCGAESHFRLWDETVACSKECARKLLTKEDIDEIVDEWLDDQKVDGGYEAEMEW